jgi:hypothetical protein
VISEYGALFGIYVLAVDFLPGRRWPWQRKISGKNCLGSGHILTADAYMDIGNPINLRAMMAAAKEYEKYQGVL